MAKPKATHCQRGHEYTAENTVLHSKGRSCRACRNASAKIRYNANAELRKRLNEAGAAYRARIKQQVKAAEPVKKSSIPCDCIIRTGQKLQHCTIACREKSIHDTKILSQEVSSTTTR